MKKMIVLKVESEKGEQYSLEVEVDNLFWENVLDLVFNGDPDYNPKESLLSPLTNTHNLDVVLNSFDESLVGMALDALTSDLTKEQLNNLYAKFEKSNFVQYCMIGYCFRMGKISMLKKLCKSDFADVREEAKGFFEM